MEQGVYQNSGQQLVVNGEKDDKENIYQELKSDFNNNKSNKKSNYLIYILAILLIVCIFFIDFIHGDKPNKIREVSKSLDYVQVDGETVEVSNVKVKKIPQEVYDSMEIDPNYSQANIDRSWEQYLLGDKKHILLLTWDGCPYARNFRRELDDIFDKDSHFSYYYDKDIRDIGQHGKLSCYDRNCASFWLLENCGEGICIINPMVKEVIVDNSQDSKQIFPLLEGYVERYDESLIQ